MAPQKEEEKENLLSLDGRGIKGEGERVIVRQERRTIH
jgi:hypothetical protein